MCISILKIAWPIYVSFHFETVKTQSHGHSILQYRTDSKGIWHVSTNSRIRGLSNSTALCNVLSETSKRNQTYLKTPWRNGILETKAEKEVKNAAVNLCQDSSVITTSSNDQFPGMQSDGTLEAQSRPGSEVGYTENNIPSLLVNIYKTTEKSASSGYW